MRQTRLQAYERGQADGAELTQASDREELAANEAWTRVQMAQYRKGSCQYEYWRGFLTAVEVRPQVEN
jgi:hypothetical protein